MMCNGYILGEGMNSICIDACGVLFAIGLVVMVIGVAYALAYFGAKIDSDRRKFLDDIYRRKR